jgi:hypothetical protein
MDEMEFFFSQFPYSKYLTLQTDAMGDLLDGYRWQVLTSSLTKFDFRINLRNSPVIDHLDSFRTSFWQEEKHWYVAYQNECLFSISHFVRTQIEIPNSSPICSTVPNLSMFYDRVTKLVVKSKSVNTNVYFNHIKKLVLKCSVSPDILPSIVDLSQIEHLILLSVDDLSKLFVFESMMPRLDELTISKIVSVDRIRRIENYEMKKVRKLYIPI